MQKIYFYNTLTRKKEEFIPLKEGEAGVYSCGPTVYWNQHIGNMYAFLFDDVLVRTLRYFGYKTKWVMNITDVGHLTSDGDTGEDKLEKGAKREGVSIKEVAMRYEKQFLDSLKELNVKDPDTLCRATEHIPEQINLALKIEERGYAYKTKTGLVFDTGKFEDYAKFANLNLEEMDSGARVDVDEEKKKAWDFLLWITNQPEHIMKWESPWGEGFPGWHLECTAMSTKYLGDQFDIHTGGIEHIGVHHTNEIAQGYGAFGKQTARYWLHNAWLSLKEGKMSKSEGTVITIQDLIEKGYDPMAFRYLFLTSQYNKGLVFSFESLEAAGKAYKKLVNLVSEWKSGENAGNGSINKEFKKEFDQAMANNLSSSEALAVVWKMVKADIPEVDKLATLIKFNEVLGLRLEEGGEEEVPAEIEKLALERKRAKDNKDWSEADRIRDLLKEKGYLVEDSSEGYKIKKI